MRKKLIEDLDVIRYLNNMRKVDILCKILFQKNEMDLCNFTKFNMVEFKDRNIEFKKKSKIYLL